MVGGGPIILWFAATTFLYVMDMGNVDFFLHHPNAWSVFLFQELWTFEISEKSNLLNAMEYVFWTSRAGKWISSSKKFKHVLISPCYVPTRHDGASSYPHGLSLSLPNPDKPEIPSPNLQWPFHGVSISNKSCPPVHTHGTKVGMHNSPQRENKPPRRIPDSIVSSSSDGNQKLAEENKEERGSSTVPSWDQAIFPLSERPRAKIYPQSSRSQAEQCCSWYAIRLEREKFKAECLLWSAGFLP